MKKIIIGRNNACDIIVPDTSDLVSRKQAVLAVSFWGKKVIYDTSNNGTYVNGKKLENGKGIRVTRKDKVSFARVADLDWNDVKDPYRKEKTVSAICIALVLILSALLTFWLTRPDKDDSVVENIEIVSEKGETMTTVQEQTSPSQTEDQTDRQKRKKRAKKSGDKETNSVTSDKKEDPLTPDEQTNKQINDNSPIVY